MRLRGENIYEQRSNEMPKSKAEALAVVNRFDLSMPVLADDDMIELCQTLREFIGRTTDEFWAVGQESLTGTGKERLD